jgi:hypothetical protein
MSTYAPTYPSQSIPLFQFIGCSKESEKTKEDYEKALDDYYDIPVSRRSLSKEFYGLASEWRKDVKHLSSISEIAMHPAYQQIIGMGEKALPLIFRELEKEPGHWFWALKALTRANPVPPNYRGNISQMTRTWLNWAKENNISW